MTDDAERAEGESVNVIDSEISDIRGALGRGGNWQNPELTARLEELYRQRFGASDADAPETPSTAEPVRVAWGTGEPTADAAEVRGQVEGFFGKMGVTAAEAQTLVAFARQAFAAPRVSDEEWEAMHMSTERTLRSKWGASYDAKLRDAYQMADIFEKSFGHHPDIHSAIDNGLWLRPDVLEHLAAIAERRGVPKNMKSITSIRAELLKANEGSPRHSELLRQLEGHYRRLWSAT